MTPEKIIEVIEMYEKRLRERNVPKARVDPKCVFAAFTEDELLAHAHYLCDGAKEYARNPEKYGKANRHLTAIQMCMSFAGEYTLEDLMNHNRSIDD